MNNTYPKIKNFTDLKTWQAAHLLVLSIYTAVKVFPKNEMFALSDQMRRASVSITSNIAEGCGRSTYKEKYRFYIIARGSLIELENQLLIAKDLNFITESTHIQITELIHTTELLLQGLLRKTKQLDIL